MNNLDPNDLDELVLPPYVTFRCHQHRDGTFDGTYVERFPIHYRAAVRDSVKTVNKLLAQRAKTTHGVISSKERYTKKHCFCIVVFKRVTRATVAAAMLGEFSMWTTAPHAEQVISATRQACSSALVVVEPELSLPAVTVSRARGRLRAPTEVPHDASPTLRTLLRNYPTHPSGAPRAPHRRGG